MEDFNNNIEPKTICLLGASFNTENRGVAALATGAVTAARHAYPDGKIYLLDYAKEPSTYNIRFLEGVAQVDLENIRFSKKLLLKNNIAYLIVIALCARLLPAGPRRDNYLATNQVLDRINNTTIFGSIAGGDSFSDIYGLGRLLYVSLPQILVILMNKPLVLLPQTIGPFKGVIGKAIGKFILRRAEVVYARDEESLGCARMIMGNTLRPFKFCFDVAHIMEPVAPENSKMKVLEKLGKVRPLIGLNVSGLLYIGGYSGNNTFGLKPNYPQLIKAIIQYFVKQNTDVLLVPHVFGSQRDSESDTCTSHVLYDEMKVTYPDNLHLLTGDFDHQEIKFVIGKCNFFLGSRMHACIAALSQNIPAVGLAYSRKFAGVYKAIKAEELCADLSFLDQEQVLQLIAKAFQQKNAFSDHLAEQMPKVKQTVFGLFTGLNI